MTYLRILIPGFSSAYDSAGGTLASCCFWVLFNLALAAEILWTEWLPDRTRLFLWGITLAAWVAAVSLARSGSNGGQDDRRDAAATDDPFPAFLDYYLRGDWDVLAAKLTRHLELHPQDVESRLMLASTLRRQGRLREARRQLEHLRQTDCSGRWILEVHREKALLRQMEQDGGECQAEPRSAESASQTAQKLQAA